MEIGDTITKILSRDLNNGYSVLTFYNINVEYTDTELQELLQETVNKFPILKQHIIEKNSDMILEHVDNFQLSEHYKIIYDNYNNFDSYIDEILNSKFETKSKWLIRYIIDKENKKYRIFFKIDHSYADGYKIIEMLMTLFIENDTKTVFKSHKTNIINTIYYAIFGTIILIYMYIKTCIDILSTPQITPNLSKTDFIRCMPIKLSEIKKFSDKKKIKVNDFLYSLMIKADSLYRGVNKELITCSPINISGLKNHNNMMPVFNKIKNSMNNNDLFNSTNHIFNCYKYSLFIPFLSFIVNNITSIIPLSIVDNFYSSYIYNCDYIYSNIIGPEHEDIDNLHFLTTAKDKEIIFNIISYNDNINIICSFKEGIIQDKERFEKCIYDAYDSLIRTYDA
jgi:hypothetical protein